VVLCRALDPWVLPQEIGWFRMPNATDAQPDSLRELGTLRVRTVRHGDTHVIELTGELDIAGIPAVERELERAEDARSVVLDLRRLEFIDSGGVRVVVVAHCRRPGRLTIIKGPACVQRVFDICGLVERLPFVDESPYLNSDGHSDGPVTAASLVAITTAGSRRAAAIIRADQGAMEAAVQELCSRRGVSRLL
jgi:anti-anti-sigma factor